MADDRYEDEDFDDEEEFEEELDEEEDDGLDYLLASIDANNRANRDIAAQIEAMRQQLSQPQAQQPRPEDSYTNLLYTNPEKFVEQVREEVTSNLSQRYEQDQMQQQAQMAYQQFWQNFNNRYPEFSDDLDLAEAYFQRNFNNYSDLNVSDAMDVLAEDLAERLGYEEIDDEDYVDTHTEMGRGVPRQSAVEQGHPQGGLASVIAANRAKLGIR